LTENQDLCGSAQSESAENPRPSGAESDESGSEDTACAQAARSGEPSGAVSDDEQAACRLVDGCVRFDQGEPHRIVERVALEVPVSISFNGIYYNVLSCTPCDFEDIAYGVAYSAGFITSADDVRSVEVTQLTNAYQIDVILKTRGGFDYSSFMLSSISGVPIRDAEVRLPSYFPAHMVHIGPMSPIPPQAITAASNGLLERQGMHRRTGATHAAAFVDREGAFRFMSEDIGRHNAVDKLIGRLVRNRVDPLSGFAFLSSRCALELVNKLARYGIGVVATVSAPTSAVIDFALEANVTLCAFSRGNRFTVYTHPERIAIDCDGADDDEKRPVREV